MRVDALVAVVAEHEQAAGGHLHRNETQAGAAREASWRRQRGPNYAAVAARGVRTLSATRAADFAQF